jgi:hypothetical protein
LLLYFLQIFQGNLLGHFIYLQMSEKPIEIVSFSTEFQWEIYHVSTAFSIEILSLGENN